MLQSYTQNAARPRRRSLRSRPVPVWIKFRLNYKTVSIGVCSSSACFSARKTLSLTVLFWLSCYFKPKIKDSKHITAASSYVSSSWCLCSSAVIRTEINNIRLKKNRNIYLRQINALTKDLLFIHLFKAHSSKQ